VLGSIAADLKKRPTRLYTTKKRQTKVTLKCQQVYI